MARVIQDIILPNYYSSVTIPAAQVLTIFTTPVQLAEAQAGYFLIPLWGWVEKPAGIAYVINGQTAFGIYYGTQILLYNAAGAGFFDQATATFRFTRGPGTVGSTLVSTVFDATFVTGLPLTITAATANMTTGDSPVRVTTVYTKVPRTPSWF